MFIADMSKASHGTRSVFTRPPALILQYINHGTETNHVPNYGYIYILCQVHKQNYSLSCKNSLNYI